MGSPASSTSPIDYRLLSPKSTESITGFSMATDTSLALHLPERGGTQAARICIISKNVLCNICAGSTGVVCILSGAILATIYHQEIPAVVVTIVGLALCYFPVGRLLITDCHTPPV